MRAITRTVSAPRPPEPPSGDAPATFVVDTEPFAQARYDNAYKRACYGVAGTILFGAAAVVELTASYYFGSPLMFAAGLVGGCGFVGAISLPGTAAALHDMGAAKTDLAAVRAGHPNVLMV